MPRNAGAFLGGATGGLTKLAAALAGGGASQQDAYDQQMMAQTKLGQALAQMRAHDANAAYDAARAGTETQKQGILSSRPDLYEEQAALAAGTDIPTLRAFRERTRTGQAPQVPMGPETEAGGMGVGSAQFPPQLQSGLARSLQQFLPLLSNSGDLKPDDLAQAAQVFRGMGLGDQVLSGQLPAADVGRSQAAVAGKPLFDAQASGTVLDPFSGALNEAGGLARSNIAENQAQAAHARAQAAAAKNTDGRLPVGYRWRADGGQEPIPGGPASISEKKGAPTEDERKAAGWYQQAKFAFDNMESVLSKHPEAAKQQTFPAMVGAIPMVGGALKNAMTSEARQRFEQAASSFAEAALRAATGAGVNHDEAQQKIAELTPQWGDKPGNVAQKKAALVVYLNSLQGRAGRAIPAQAQPAASPGAGPLTRMPPRGADPEAQAPAARNIVVDW